MSATIATRCRGDRGQVGGIEVLPFGFLVFVAATLLIANVWGVVDAKFAVSAAAREATRAYVEADSADQAAATSQQRGHETLAAFGRADGRASVGQPVLAEPFGRCTRVTIVVSYSVPVIAVPFIGGLGNIAPVTSSHTAIVDPFRDGLHGEANC